MKNSKKMIALLVVALLIPMTVLAAACQHKQKGSIYYKTQYVNQNPSAHTKVVTPVRDCLKCGKTFTAGTATRTTLPHSKVRGGIADKRIIRADQDTHTYEVTFWCACSQCGATNLPTEKGLQVELHHFVFSGTELVNLVFRNVYTCTTCGMRKYE